MKPEELIPGQRYRLREGLSPSIEADSKGTDRIVELFSSSPRCNECIFMWRNYTDCIATVRAEDIECRIPRIGEEALFYNKDSETSTVAEMWSYAVNLGHPFLTSMGTFRHCKPLPKKATPVPDRNQTFELAELGAMQEEKIATDDDWRGAIDIKLDDLTKRLDAVEAKDIRAVAHDELLAILFKNWNKTAVPVNPFYARTTDDKGL